MRRERFPYKADDLCRVAAPLSGGESYKSEIEQPVRARAGPLAGAVVVPWVTDVTLAGRRKPYLETAPVSGVSHAHLAAMRLDDAAHDRQAQSGAAIGVRRPGSGSPPGKIEYPCQ